MLETVFSGILEESSFRSFRSFGYEQFMQL